MTCCFGIGESTMQEKRVYTIGATKLKMAYMEGFSLSEDGALSVEKCGSGMHFVILNRFCSYERNTKWGRFHCRAELSSGQTLRISAFAIDGEAVQAERLNSLFQNPSVPFAEKKEYFTQRGIQFLNHTDVLLYELEGEYLWIAIEADGDDCVLSELVLDSAGDNFMQTFPEIYQEEGGFFHRYLSVYSSVYQDIGAEIGGLDRYLEIDRMPAAVLPEIADWMGVEVEGTFLEEETLRKLVKALYYLNRIKGTREALKRLIKLVFDEDAVIIERSRIEGYIPKESRQTYLKLYGDSLQDVTILINRPQDERLQAQMMFLIRQFKPVRSRVKLVFNRDCDMLDSYCYLDQNASLTMIADGELDHDCRMNEMVVLQY